MTTSVVETAYSPTQPVEVSPAHPEWNVAQRVGFRFAFAFFVLYSVPSPFLELLSLPGLSKGVSLLAAWYNAHVWGRIVPWVGFHVLHVGYAIQPRLNGSGDQTYHWVRLLAIVLISLTMTLVWSSLDRRRTEYRLLYDWLRVYMRFVLAFAMLGYGSVKVIKGQFASPSLTIMAGPFGNLSPMGLLWHFMGYSTPYGAFAGAGEFVAGLLLFFRRTTTLGALLAFAVMSNVAMMNYSYASPVKLYSTYLVVLALVLIIPDLRRLASVLVFNRNTPPAELRPVVRGRTGRIVRTTVKVCALVAGAILPLKSSWELLHTYLDLAPTPPLYGVYDVERFIRNGDTVVVGTDPSRWRQVVVDRTESETPLMVVRLTNDLTRYYGMRVDTVGKHLALFYDFIGNGKIPHPLRDGAFALVPSDSMHLDLNGVLEQDSVHILLRRHNFFLMSRGFHWITDDPVQGGS